MISPKFIRENLTRLEENCRKRSSPFRREAFLALEEERLGLLKKSEALKEKRNRNAAAIAQLKGKKDRTPSSTLKKLYEQGSALKKEEQEISQAKRQLEQQQAEFCLTLPNLLAAEVPAGKDERDNVLVRRWGEPTKFPFKAKDHVEIGEKLDIIDFERAAKLTGARFALMKKAGARLERALANFFLEENTSKAGGSYQEIKPAAIINATCLQGTGQLPKFSKELFNLKGNGENFSSYYLTPTAEVALTNLHRKEILPANALPKNFTAYTPCFRSEAGAAGKDTRGLIRLHEFYKVELVKITKAEEAEEEHEKMVQNVERLLQKLELPYRVMLLSAGDTGFSASKCYDLEVWLPGQEKYREISSCSNCSAFQTGRAEVRYRDSRDNKIKLAHSLNGSALPIGRTIVALLENHQQADATVRLPKALVPYMKTEILKRED